MQPMTKPVWSWVRQLEHLRPRATRPGRYVRPLSIRDQVIAEAFGLEVRRLRIERQLSTDDLARLMGMSQPAITKIEGAKVAVELRLMWDFAEALAVKPSRFVKACEEAVAVKRGELSLEQPGKKSNLLR